VIPSTVRRRVALYRRLSAAGVRRTSLLLYPLRRRLPPHHQRLDLDSGDYELYSAGHPPGLQLSAGSGRWEEKAAEGPLLGVYDGAQFDPVKGSLRPGDVLMLFTDGLVETSDRDIVEGIDRLTGEADRYVAGGFHGAAWHLIEAVAKDVNDDRALLLICREGSTAALPR